MISGCIVFAALTAIYPFARAAFRVEVGYNEGWNVYNAQRVVNHLPLYPVANGWTMVNYPVLSFELMAWLHHFTHDYLFTARAVSILSLMGGCVLVGAIVRRLTQSYSASLLAGFLCFGIFCTNADAYVGMDDPQLLAHFFFLLAFYVFVRRPGSYAALASSAAIFVVAGSIKHNPLDIPLAVLIEIVILSWRRALWFSTCGLVLTAVALFVNVRVGGPFFVTEMLAPRLYSYRSLLDLTVGTLGPLLIPVVLALIAGVVFLHEPRRRLAGILLFTSLAVGLGFAGGVGVWTNAFFSFFFAVAIVLGLVFAELERGRGTGRSFLGRPLARYAVPTLFLSLIIPALVNHIANPIAMLHETAQAQARFDREVAFLRTRPNSALCESLLRCYFAGEPYLYDPFNATRLVEFHRLDPSPVLDALHAGSYSAVQVDQPLDDPAKLERFPLAIRRALVAQYQPALIDQDVIVLVPKRTTAPVESSGAGPIFPR